MEFTTTTKTQKSDRANRASSSAVKSTPQTPTHKLLQMQQTLGNRAVSRLIQTKLKVGKPGDVYEREADRIADRVMQMPNPQGKTGSINTPAIQPLSIQRMGSEEDNISRMAMEEEKLIQKQAEDEESSVQMKEEEEPTDIQTKPLVQRQAALEEEEKIQAKCETCEQEKQIQRASDVVAQVRSNLESQLNSSQGGGSPLSNEVRSFMEPRFGADFSGVRVHTDSTSVQMNKELGAQAFTHNKDIYFGAGKNPNNDALTAHELTHTIQQSPNTPKLTASFDRSNNADLVGQFHPNLGTITRSISGVVQGSWIGDRISWVRTAIHDENWADADPPGAYYVLNGLSMDDMVRILRALTPTDRKKLSENLEEQATGFDRSRIQLALTNAATPLGDKWWRDLSERIHWAIRSSKFVDYPDGAFWIINPLNAQDTVKIMTFLNRDSLDELIVNRNSAIEADVPNAERILTAANKFRENAGSTKREQRLIDLIDGRDWKAFFTEFNVMNETDQLRFLRGYIGATAQITNNINQAAGISDQDHLRYLIEKVTTDASTNLYVDAMVKTYTWQPKYRVNDSKEYSRIIRFGHNFDIEIDINTIDDGTISNEEAEQQFREAKPGPGGFLWPAVRNRSTLPILWQVKQDIHKNMETLLFDDVLAAGIFVINYILDVVFPIAHSTAIRSLKALERASLSTRWMKGAQVIKGRVSPEVRAKELAKQMAKEGHPVIANIGGAGARHEPANAININNQAVARKDIPNLVEADGSRIGELFNPATVDRIEGHNMAPGAIDWSKVAPGAKSVLKPGGKINYYYRGANLDAKVAEQELKKAGFINVNNFEDVLITATRP